VRFDRIRLRNFKCYADADVALDSGVTVIFGMNGSGKSSLLEACFFALYGAGALDRTLDEVITIGAEEAEIDLWFTHAGGDYHLHRRIRYTGDTPQTADCVLETPDGSIDGVTDVEGHIAELLRMDEEAFVNCAYVRQGEVNKLINASPSSRQDMIDDLLQLGTLEDYRQRASDARLAVEDVLTGKRGGLENLEAKIEEKENRDLHQRLNATKTALSEVQDDIESLESGREQAQETRAEAESTLEAYEENQQELETVTDDIQELKARIARTEQERQTLMEDAQEHAEAVESLESDIETKLADTALETADEDALDDRRRQLVEEKDALNEEKQDVVSTLQAKKSAAETAEERADELTSRAQEKREQADELEAEAAERAERVESGEAELDALEDRIESTRTAFDDAPVEFGDAAEHLDDLEAEQSGLQAQQTTVFSKLTSARERVEEAEALLAEGKCPECGQDVDGSPHVDSVEEDRERVAELEDELASLEADLEDVEDRIENAEGLVEAETTVEQLREKRESKAELLDQLRSQLETNREQVAALRADATDLDEQAAEARETAETAREAMQARQQSLGELNQAAADVDDQLVALDDLAAAIDDRDEHAAARERLLETRANKAELIETWRETVAEKRRRKQELADQYDEAAVTDAKNEKQRAEDYLSETAERLADLREERDALQKRIGSLENAIEELAELREEAEALQETVDRLQALHAETRDLQAAYGDLRAELRQRNVTRLEALLNETFDLVYENDSYSRIELSGSYELTVYQKDGEPLDPEQLSGGERALFNLSLRTAIYRLLAEGIEGAAPMPPLILDEPTVFLDRGHVSRLRDLIDAMRDIGVEQIIVVSHDDELEAAADDIVEVEKDPTTNRSHVERTNAIERAAEAAAGDD
jgi:exonuclease SbcC